MPTDTSSAAPCSAPKLDVSANARGAWHHTRASGRIADLLAGFLVIVVAPTVFWTLAAHIVSHVVAGALSFEATLWIAIPIGLFLTGIWGLFATRR